MKRKVWRVIFSLLVFLIVYIYFLPAPQADFDSLYGKQDSFSKSLSEFRQRTTQQIKIDNVNWEYYTGGVGDTCILFLHGMGGSYDLWWNQILDFENNFRVLSYSLPDDINTLFAAQNGILAILEKEHISSLFIVGTSMGGYIAQYLLNNHPDLIKKTVLGNTFPPNNLFRTLNSGKRKIMPFLPEILISKLGEKQLANSIIPAAKNSKLLAAFLPSLPFSKKQFIGRYDIVVDTFKVNYSAHANIPMLIIESDNDPLILPELQSKLKGLYPKAEVYTFHEEGHFPYINAANEYNKVLHDFFRKNE